MKTQKKKFVITNRTNITPTNHDLKKLQRELDEYARKINFIHWGFTYNQRIFYFVSDMMIDNKVSMHIKFRSEDMKKHPDKYGEEFRSKCISFAWQKANEILNEDKTAITVTIYEDADKTEEINYVRK